MTEQEAKRLAALEHEHRAVAELLCGDTTIPVKEQIEYARMSKMRMFTVSQSMIRLLIVSPSRLLELMEAHAAVPSADKIKGATL